MELGQERIPPTPFPGLSGGGLLGILIEEGAGIHFQKQAG